MSHQERGQKPPPTVAENLIGKRWSEDGPESTPEDLNISKKPNEPDKKDLEAVKKAPKKPRVRIEIVTIG